MRNMSTTAMGIGAIGIFVALFLIYALTQVGKGESDPSWVTAMMNDDANLPGQYFAPHPGADGQLNTTDDREHYGNGTVVPICSDAQLEAGTITDPVCYTSNPPTSGPHSVSPMAFKVLENPAPKENLIHNMEHGGIVIWYNSTNQDVIDELTDLANEQIDRRRFVVMTAYSGMEAETIAVTAWTRLDKFPVSQFEKGRIEDFISEHHKRFNPEGF